MDKFDAAPVAAHDNIPNVTAQVAAPTIEGGQAPCESTDGCTRAQVTWEQAISHAGTDHEMAAQPVPPSPDAEAERDVLRAALRQIYFLDHNEREWESVQEVKLFAERAAIDAAMGVS